jgi:hypothetical protein
VKRIAGMTWWKQVRKLAMVLPIALLILVFSNVYLIVWSFNSAKADSVQVSPGKILPQGYNEYLNTSDVQVKLEYPKAIILQQTMGDLVFNVTTKTSKQTIAIYIPPEFKLSRGKNYVWTSITNDYRSVSVSTLSDRDPIAPNWWRISVSAGFGGGFRGGFGGGFGGGFEGVINKSNSTIIRVFNVTAPSIVGRYFFKVFTDGASIGATNFPTLVVSADINPAYISGTVLDGSRDPSRYGHPIQLTDSEGGRVVGVGVTPQGRIVTGQAFFNASAEGRYTLYGLAPGTYQLTACASGYANSTKPDLVGVVAGQSLETADIFVYPSPELEGIVWSKCHGLLVPWGPIATFPPPGAGAALVYGGQDFIYAFRGVDTSDFIQYDAEAKAWNFFPASALGLVGPGGALAFDGLTYIYALEGGGSTTFWSFDTLVNTPRGLWALQANTPSPVGDGGALAFATNTLYALGGGDTNDFWKYDPIQNLWSDLTPSAPTPTTVGIGGSLAFDSTNQLLYAFGGGNSFWSHVTSNGSAPWTDLSPLTFSVGAGGSLAYDPNTNLLYALQGGNTNNFWYFDGTTWNSLTSTPAAVGPGGSLTFNPTDGRLYALGGGDPTYFWSYDPTADSWTTLSSFPSTYPRPITVEILDSLGNSQRLLQNFTDLASDRFDFSYDGSIVLDGHIPQNFSGYVSGISPGLYIVEVWVNQYLQPDMLTLPGTNAQITGVEVQLPDYETITHIQLDVHRTGLAEVVVHFKNFGYIIQETPVDSSKTITVQLYDHNRVLRAANSTRVSTGNSSSLVSLTGFLGTIHDYGLPMDTYIIGVAVNDNSYYLPVDSFLTIGECNSVANVSLALIRLGSVKVSIRSVDSQTPPEPRNWAYPGSSVRMQIRDQYGVLIAVSNSTIQDGENYLNVSATGLSTGTYSIYVFTYGYIQTKPYYIFVMDGATSDTVVDIVQGSKIDLAVVLEKEGIFTTIDTYPLSSSVPARVEVLDAQNRFVAATITRVQSNASTFSVTLAGFQSYAGSYIHSRWVNYYDTTDGAFQTDYGLGPGLYTLQVFLPGFAQSHVVVTAELPVDGEASVILHLNRLAHLSGHVYSFNMFDELVPLNWATIDAIGEKMHDFTPTLDGSFNMWLEPGNYLVICSLDGDQSATRQVYLPNGSDIPIDIYPNPLQS